MNGRAAGEPTAALVAGVGARRGVPVGEVLELLDATLATVDPAARIVALATVADKSAEPGLLGAARRLGVPLRSFPAAELAAVRVPAPSAAAAAAVGTPSVAEAAALLAAGPGAELLAGKRKSAPRGRPARATCALAGRAVTDHGGVTAGREGAAEAPSGAADIVMTSSNPPRRGTDRRTAAVGGPAPDSTTTGTKETQ
ncbi:cobalamin biosynthesis protein [Streptomyces sioyaensis]|uniref:cobalamin biosynthesis protein n=1 Tax=Streptomyces sioyaensis TaxID=67364 RepID=UPI0035AB8F17|nr:cobalamin biosynthesis protein [Streptomyces sioyaensis]